MRNKLLPCGFAAAIVLVAAVIVGALDRPDRDVFGYNVLAERIFKGVVAGKGQTIDGLMYFPLKTADTTVDVQIGPREFVERRSFKLLTGDMVTVIGMPVVMKERKIVLAREVSSTNGLLIVRDQVGLPLWEKNRPTLMDPEQRVRFSDECALIK